MNNSESIPIAILCSGIALGVYNPALTLRNRLQAIGRPCRVCVLENLHNHQRRENIMQIKQAFHRNFSLARNSQKMTGNIVDTFESGLVEELLEQWKREDIQIFCIFSGFWLPIVKQYQRSVKTPTNVHLCYMDAVPSTSWKPFVHETVCYREHRLFDYNAKRVTSQLPVSTLETNSFYQKKERVVIHGGGWGMGTYQQAIEDLTTHHMPMDIICYEQNDIKDRGETVRNFMIDPQWKPWEQINGDYVFPPFAEVKVEIDPVFIIPTHYPDVYDLAACALGIISKPGGATLLDSFSSATPLIFLPETFGEYEKKNGELWRILGFGVDYSTWCHAGYSTALLQDLHHNILCYKEKERLPFLAEEIAYAT